MNKKQIFLSICLFIVFFSLLSVASASDTSGNVTVTAVSDDSNAISVTNNQDYILGADPGSFKNLNDTITGSQAGQAINLTGDYSYSGSDGNFSEGILIDKSITIDGQGYTINAQGNASIFNIQGNSKVILKNITFVNAYGSYGGAIKLDPSTHLEIINCNFINNTAKTSGGAIYVENSSSLTSNLIITGSTFRNNTASFGGAVYLNENSHDLSIIENSKFIDCTSSGDGGAAYISADNVELKNVVFDNNVAGDDGGAIYWEGNNGIIENITCTNNRGISVTKNDGSTSSTRGGTICLTGNNVTVSKSKFINSSAFMDSDKDTSKVDGGAIFVTGNDISITEVDFIECNATNNGGALYVIGNHTQILRCNFESNTGMDGGALYVEGDGCKLINSTFKGNIADDDGGAIYWEGDDGIIYNITCTNNKGISKTKPDGVNTSSTRGGTLSIIGNNLTLSKSHFRESHADMDANKDSSKVDGGAIFITGNDIVISETEFNDCSAVNNGGAIYIIGNHTRILNSSMDGTKAYVGGAIYIAGDDTLVDGILFRRNTASGYSAGGVLGGSGGAIYVEGERATVSHSDFAYDNAVNYGGAISVWGAGANITDNTFDNSTTDLYDGGAIYVNGVNATISRSNFTRSIAKNEYAHGGAIQVSGDRTKILGCNFDDCYAYFGGVIHISGSNTVIDNSAFEQSLIYDGSSPYEGGAIYVNGSYTSISKSNFSDYTSEQYGGAIYIFGPNTIINYSNFDNCKGTYGGDIYVFGNNAKIYDSTFNSSSATYGGAIYLTAWGALIKDSNVTDCIAAMDGGAIYVAGGGTNIVGDNFEGCIAKGNSNQFVDGGGAIYIQGPDTWIANSNFNNNKVTGANAFGGTIYINGERTNIVGSNFNNSQANQGGIIYIMGEQAIIDASTFNNSHSSNKGGAISVNGNKATIERSAFENVYANNHGGAIYVDGEQTNILQSSFYDCRVNGKYNGGAIYIDDMKTTVAYSNFSSCKADSAGAIYINGINTSILYCNLDNNTAGSAGAIKVFGNDTIISNSNFTNNNATFSDGGALDIGGSNASVSSCWFDNNDAVGNGGAINWKGGHGDDTILGSTFTNNGCHGIREGGGAIFWTSGDPNNIPPGGLILNCIFINNTAYGHHGGAIDWFYARDSTINNCLFLNNTANSDGGALYTGDQKGHGHHLMMSNCQFYNNTAGKHGGAITNQMSDSWIYNNTFDGNKATASGGTIVMKEGPAVNSVIDHCYIYNSFINQTYTGNSYGVGGGAIRIDDKNVTISNCAIINSTANKTWGGAIYIASGCTNSSLINVSIQNSRILDGYGGAIFWRGSYGTMDNVTIVNSSSNVVDNSIIYTSDIPKSANGGAIYLAGANCNLNDIKIFQSSTNSFNESCSRNNHGGAIYVSGASNTLTNVSIDESSALSVKMNSNGGAIYWEGNLGTLINATISNTLANGQGGAIYWRGGSPTISNISIEYSQTNVTNSSNAANGGAMYLENVGNLNNVYIINALASRDVGDIFGGAIYFRNTNKVTTSMNNITVIGSRASTGEGGSYGGAIYWGTSASTHNLYNSSFAENTADYGGALYSVGATNIWNTSFTGNVALDGGALYSTGMDYVLNNASFSHNSAKRGGAIFVNNHKIQIHDSSLEFNTAEQKGGAIYYNNAANNRNFEITNTNLTNNTAFQGSAIYSTKFGNFYMQDVILLDNQANSKEFVEKTVGFDNETGKNYTSAVFIGFDNLLNAIWHEANVPISCNNVTYWDVGGRCSTSSSPEKSDREANINVTVETYNGLGQRVAVANLTTDGNGRVYYAFDAKEGEKYYFAYIHPVDRYYTYLRDTLSNRSLVNLFVDEVIFYTQNQTFLIYLTDGAWGSINGTVTLTFNDTKHTTIPVDIVNGSDGVTFKKALDLLPGTYNVTARFDGDSNHTGDSDWKVFTVLPYTDLRIVKVANVTGDIKVTDKIEFNITVFNDGPCDATNVSVSEYLDYHLRLISNTSSVGAYDYKNSTWYIGDLANGTNATLRIVAQVIYSGNITNAVLVSCNERESNYTNNRAEVGNITARAFVDLKINKTVNVTTGFVNVTDKVKFVITVTNNGPANASGVYVGESFDYTHLRMISNSTSKGRFDGATWIIGNLNNGEVHNLTIIAEVIASGNFSNFVTVTGSDNDTNKSNNNFTTDNITALDIVDLEITKKVNVTNALVNVTDVIVFTITVHNNGPCGATNVNVTEVLSSHLKMIDNKTAYGHYDVNKGVWYIGNLANQSTAVLTISARVVSVGTIANVVFVNSTENDTNKSNNRDNITNITALPIVDLDINKTVNVTDGIVNVTDVIEYTITVKNNGPCNATNVTVYEKLSPSLKLISASAASYNNVTGVWFIGNLTNKSTEVLKLVCEVIKSGTIPNMVNVTGNENDTNKTNNRDNRTVEAFDIVDLKVTKKVNVTGTEVDVTDKIRFTITVHNNGPCNVTGVNVTEVLSPCLRMLENKTANGYYNVTEGIWHIGYLANGSDATLTIVAQVVYSGIIENVVIVTSNENDTNMSNNKDNITPLNASAHVDLEIRKIVNVTTGAVNVTDLIQFTVNLTNKGPCNATGVYVKEPLDYHLDLVSYNATKGEYRNKYTWDIGNLDAGETVTLTIVARVISAGNITNVVDAFCYDNDTNSSNNHDEIDNITAYPIVDLAITKEVNVTSGFVNIYDKVKFTITVRNNGPCDATGVLVTESLDSHLGRDYTYEATPGTTYDGYTWNIYNLANQSSAVLTIIANVTSLGTISNFVVVKGNENDTNISNNKANITNITVLPLVDVRVNKTVDATIVNVTDYVTYTINVVNVGPCDAHDVNVTEHLSPLVKLVEATASIGTYSNNIWNIPELNVNVPATLLLKVQVIANGTIENAVTVTSRENDTNKSNNNYTSENVTALPVVDLMVNKTVNVTVVNVTSLVEYTIVVKNNGPSNATGVIVTDKLDSRLKFVSFESSRAGITYNNVTGRFDVGNLDVNESVVLTIVARVIGIGEIPNAVNVTGRENDTNKSNNNYTSDNVTALPVVDLMVNKTVNVTVVNVTDLVEYIIVVKNDGPSNATGVVVSDELDSRLKFVSFGSSRAGITYDNVTGRFDVGNLDAGEVVTLSIVARVIGIGEIPNTVNVTGRENDTNKSNNNYTSDNVTALPVVDLMVNKTVNATRAYVGDLIEYIIVVKNDGPSNATGVVVTDKLDSRLKFVSFESSRAGIIYDDATGNFAVGSLDADEGIVLTVVARVIGIGEIPNTVNVTGHENDTNKSNNNYTSDNVTALPVVDVKVNKTVSVTEAKVGDEIVYTIMVQNNGPNDATNVNVTGKLSNNVVFVKYTASKGNYFSSENIWYIGKLTNGSIATLTLTVKAVGEGTVENAVIVNSTEKDSNLTNNNYTCENVTVTKLDTPIDLYTYNITYGDDEILRVELPENATGTVNITVGNRTYDNVPINGGKVELPVTDLAGGDYNVTVIYGGDDKYAGNSTSDIFNVARVTPIITIEVEDIWVWEIEVLNVTVNAPGSVFVTVYGITVEIPLNNGVVTTDILKATAKPDYKGNATWNIINLPAGTYPAFALYPGNENYTSVNTSDVFIVRDLIPTNVIVTADDIYVGDDAVINVVVGPEGVTGNVTVNVDGKNYTVPLDDGKAILVVPGLKAGEKDVTVWYEGNRPYLPSENTTTFNVLKYKPPVDIDAPEITVGEDGVIIVTVPDDATGTITIEIDGKRYTEPIVDGEAVFIIPGLDVGTHDITAFYSGDDKYLPANTTGEIKVNPKDEPDDHNKTPKKSTIDNKMHATGNPIMALIAVLMSICLVQTRRFKK